jgi:S1-C subfamily serine protease
MRTIAAITFLLCSSVVCQSQNPQPTAPPAAPPPPATVEDIELNTALMESTFMIEGRGPQGSILGTVFIMARLISNVTPEAGRLVMITAAHVLEEMPGDVAVLHLRKKVDQKTNSWIPFLSPIQIRVNGQPQWKRHPDVDVAVMYISLPADMGLRVMTTKLFADDEALKEYEIKPGDEVRCLGFPLGVTSNDAGFPVLRSGRIASYPILPTEKTKSFLLDFRVFKGNSGGPVYFVERYRPNMKTFGSFTNYHFIIGLVSEETLLTQQVIGPYSQEIRQTQLDLAKVIHGSLIKQTIEMLPTP